MKIKIQKDLLEQESQEIIKELESLGHRVKGDDFVVEFKNSDSEHSDLLDDANLTEEFQANIAVANVLEARLSQVKRALNAIEFDAYGICTDCSAKISNARLEAFPSATTCITHAE